MIRIKVCQRETGETGSPRPMFFDLNEENHPSYMMPLVALVEGVNQILEREAPGVSSTDTLKTTSIRQIVCTHPALTGEIIIELPNNLAGYRSDQIESRQKSGE